MGAGLILFFFGAITTVLALQLPIGTLRAAGSGFFPLCLGLLLAVLAFFHLMSLRFQATDAARRPQADHDTPRSQAQMLLSLGTMALATLLLDPLGYPLVSFLLMVALLRVLGTQQWPFNLLVSLITATASYFLFVQWLKIPLPKGWIGL